MEMKKYSQLVLWSIFSVLMIQSLSAKEVLSANFEPTTVRTQTDEIIIRKNLARGEKLDKTPAEIYEMLKDAENYKTMYPTLKGWLDKNKDNFYQRSAGTCILYRDNNVGVEVVLNIRPQSKIKDLHFNRTYFKNPEDSAWTYTQTKAINPKTKKPWFPLEKEDVKKIEKITKQKFSKEDASYIIDLLSILNENFHFYYGEEIITLNDVKDKSTLMGKYKPPKILAYGAFDEFLPPESQQKRELSSKLGRAVYPFYKMIDNSKQYDGTANCADKGTIEIPLKDGQPTILLTYFNQVNPKDIEVGYSECLTQGFSIRESLPQLSKSLMNLMQEKGVDVLDEKANKTPLTLALYQINLKVQNNIDAVLTNQYIVEIHPELISNKKLADLIHLPVKLKPISLLKMDSIASQKPSVTNMCYPPRTR